MDRVRVGKKWRTKKTNGTPILRLHRFHFFVWLVGNSKKRSRSLHCTCFQWLRRTPHSIVPGNNTHILTHGNGFETGECLYRHLPDHTTNALQKVALRMGFSIVQVRDSKWVEVLCVCSRNQVLIVTFTVSVKVRNLCAVEGPRTPR